MIKTISEQIESITKEVDEIIDRDETLKTKNANLDTVLKRRIFKAFLV